MISYSQKRLLDLFPQEKWEEGRKGVRDKEDISHSFSNLAGTDNRPQVIVSQRKTKVISNRERYVIKVLLPLVPAAHLQSTNKHDTSVVSTNKADQKPTLFCVMYIWIQHFQEKSLTRCEVV